MEKSVFILSKNPIHCHQLEAHLMSLGLNPQSFTATEPLLIASEPTPSVLIFIDKSLGRREAEDWVTELKLKLPKAHLILLLDHQEMAELGNYIKYGVSDFVQKPIQFEALKLRTALHLQKPSQVEKADGLLLATDEILEEFKYIA